MEREQCYIDRNPCAGARFSFCDDCKIAQNLNADVICHAKTPAELTLAHCLTKEQKTLVEVDYAPERN